MFSTAARAQALDMMLNNYVGHKSSTGHNFEARMRAFSGDGLMMPRMAENVARDRQGGAANHHQAPGAALHPINDPAALCRFRPDGPAPRP